MSMLGRRCSGGRLSISAIATFYGAGFWREGGLPLALSSRLVVPHPGGCQVWEIKRASGGDPQKMLALLREVRHEDLSLLRPLGGHKGSNGE